MRIEESVRFEILWKLRISIELTGIMSPNLPHAGIAGVLGLFLSLSLISPVMAAEEIGDLGAPSAVVYVVPVVIVILIAVLVVVNLRRKATVLKNCENGTIVYANGDGAKASGPIVINKTETHVNAENSSGVINVNSTYSKTVDQSVHEDNSVKNSNIASGQALMTDMVAGGNTEDTCPFCGANISADAKFCSACGKQLTK